MGVFLLGYARALVSNLLVQILVQRFANQRQERQLAHDREVRQQQFAHDQEQEIRGRRTVALGELIVLLENQVVALQELWGFLRHPNPELRERVGSAWRILQTDRLYRGKLWPIDGSVHSAIGEFSGRCTDLLRFLNSREDFSALWEGHIPALDEESVATVNRRVREVLVPLTTAIREATNLASQLNGVKVLVHSTNQERL